MVDTTIYPNDLNTKLQRNDQFSNDMCRLVKAYKTRKTLKAHIQKKDLSHFETLRDSGTCPGKKTEFADQLQDLLKEFLTSFKNLRSHKHFFEVFSSLFYTNVNKAPVDVRMELFELQVKTDLRQSTRK